MQDRWGDIPRHIERKVIRAQMLEKQHAALTGKPYCHVCNQPFKDAEALMQHNRAKHEGTK